MWHLLGGSRRECGACWEGVGGSGHLLGRERVGVGHLFGRE